MEIYDPIDLCACYDPLFVPPLDFLEACRRYWERYELFAGTVERKIGNTWYRIRTICDGMEPLADKVKRLIFADTGDIS